MNKGDLVDAVAKVVGKKKLAADTVGCVLESMTEALRKGESVTLIGFGTFKVAKRAARTGRNPQTGDEISISERSVLTFKSSQVLRKALNE